MALKKSLPSPSGATASYWRIGGCMLHDWENQFEIYLLGYVDEATRRAVNDDGSPKFSQLSFGCVRLDRAQWSAVFGEGAVDIPPKAALYEFLKTLPDWSGAKDV